MTQWTKSQFIQRAYKKICPYHTIIFQQSLITGAILNDWKTAHVVPIYKKGLKYNSEYYRTTLSPTCICCKLLEHIVVSSIITHSGYIQHHLSSSTCVS